MNPGEGKCLQKAFLFFSLPSPSQLPLPLSPQLSEPRSLLLQQNLRITILNQTTLIHHTHKVKLDNSFQFMRDRNDSVIAKLFVDERLDLDVCFSVDAIWAMSASRRYRKAMGKRHLPASSFIHNQHFAFIFPEKRSSNVEKLLRPLTEMNILHLSV